VQATREFGHSDKEMQQERRKVAKKSGKWLMTLGRMSNAARWGV